MRAGIRSFLKIRLIWFLTVFLEGSPLQAEIGDDMNRFGSKLRIGFDVNRFQKAWRQGPWIVSSASLIEHVELAVDRSRAA